MGTDTREPAAEWVATSELKPWPANPRKHDAQKVRHLAEFIREVGWGAPIVARRDGEIIAGHTRLMAAQVLGLETVPVRFVDVDERTAHLMAVGDNRHGEHGEWDASLAEVLGNFSLEDVELAGWDEDALAALLGPQIDTPQEGFAVTVTCESERQRDELAAYCDEHGLAFKAKRPKGKQ